MRERGGQTEIDTNQTYKEIETVRQMDRERETYSERGRTRKKTKK